MKVSDNLVRSSETQRQILCIFQNSRFDTDWSKGKNKRSNIKFIYSFWRDARGAFYGQYQGGLWQLRPVRV